MNVPQFREGMFSTTSGLASPTQIVEGTAVPVASADINTTAVNAPILVEIVVPDQRQARSLRGIKVTSPSEASWKRLAGAERKRAAKRGSRPRDVEKAIEFERYGK